MWFMNHIFYTTLWYMSHILKKPPIHQSFHNFNPPNIIYIIGGWDGPIASACKDVD
jgi:hypothetical protein